MSFGDYKDTEQIMEEKRLAQERDLHKLWLMTDLFGRLMDIGASEEVPLEKNIEEYQELAAKTVEFFASKLNI